MNRWEKAYSNNPRIQRGEAMKQIRCYVPNFVGMEKLSIKDMHDVLLSVNILQINRLTHGQEVRR